MGSGPRKGKKDKKDTQKKIQVIFMAQFHLFFKAIQNRFICKKNGYVYTFNGIILFYSRNFHNMVNQLYLNKTLKKGKKKKKKKKKKFWGKVGKWEVGVVHSSAWALSSRKRELA